MTYQACTLIFPHKTFWIIFSHRKKRKEKKREWWGNQTEVQEISIKLVHISTKEPKGKTQLVNKDFFLKKKKQLCLFASNPRKKASFFF
jgi:hypothetical protein